MSSHGFREIAAALTASGLDTTISAGMEFPQRESTRCTCLVSTLAPLRPPPRKADQAAIFTLPGSQWPGLFQLASCPLVVFESFAQRKRLASQFNPFHCDKGQF